ncbi:phenylalanine tRS [Acrasis kona]|uniref:phenylalanine--tRNA ligase n=1 Tax=Acrasis kona TaxID=1008807 RepID=A0AAW2ZPU9_9EUKA
MPVVPLKRDNLFQGLGKTFTEDEMSNLCFDYGIELDDITSERRQLRKEMGDNIDQAKLDAASDEELYKIEIPANRYDLLCYEGMVRALNVFRGRIPAPVFKTITPENPEVMNVKFDQTKTIRPFIVCAVLRNVTFDQDRYKSFVELQDRLHQNICRKRTLVAIGTHDLDTIQGPFSYEALPAQEINFVPLNKTESFRGDQLLEHYETSDTDKHIKPYVSILKDPSTKKLKPLIPIIYDTNRVVLSLPPIINSNHSKIKLDTKNVFIECTATDMTKAHVVLNTMVCMFSEYCKEPFTCEKVKITYNGDEAPQPQLTPDLTHAEFEVDTNYVATRLGVKLTAQEMCDLVTKMCLQATPIQDDRIKVSVPPTRSDILHACDIMEDVGIAYGFNNIPRTNPKTNTVARQDSLNQLTDGVRFELAMSGYTESLNLILCSEDDQSVMMNLPKSEQRVVLDNPKSTEFQICRISLMPGLLKTLQNSIKLGLPQQLFEVNDVVLLDQNNDVGAINKRNVSALHCSTSSGFELIHNALDRLMASLGVMYQEGVGYWLRPASDKRFFDGRCAEIMYGKDVIGIMGVLHPLVLENFKLSHPVSMMEFCIEPFL